MWHDRFARLLVRNLPNLPDILALDIHCGTGRTTTELLHRLGAGAKVLAIDPDEGALELAKTRIRAEWKNRVYFKAGHFDDVTAMADDSYNLVVANLVLGESVDLNPAIAEMIRVSKIGGRVLATVPLHGTWGEVEDIFAEILRDAGMTAALRRLDALRAIRPTGPQLGAMLRKQGVETDDYVIEHEHFQLLFPSGREFLFAPVIEHGPLQLWKAVIGKDGTPQELFWRLKEAIDTYYSGHVLAVTVNAGLVHVEVAKGTTRPGPRLAARFWRHYPELDKLWGGLAVGYAKVSDPILPFSEADIGDFDLDIDLDESDPRRRTGAVKALRQPVQTPAPEEFGLRFRVRDASETSGARPLDSAEISGVRPQAPNSEASGLRALSRLRDDGEASGTRPVRRAPVAEDDFSDVVPGAQTRSEKPADDGVPDVDMSSSLRVAVPPPRGSGADDSSQEIDLSSSSIRVKPDDGVPDIDLSSSSIPLAELARRTAADDGVPDIDLSASIRLDPHTGRPVPEASPARPAKPPPPEDDFSSLNEPSQPNFRAPEPKPEPARREPSGRSPRGDSESSGRTPRPEPSSRIPRSEVTRDAEGSGRSARPEPSSRIPVRDAEGSGRSPRPEPSSRTPVRDAEGSGRSARPEPPRDAEGSGRSPRPEPSSRTPVRDAEGSGRSARPEPSSRTPRAEVREDDFSNLDSGLTRAPEPEKPPPAEDDFSSLMEPSRPDLRAPETIRRGEPLRRPERPQPARPSEPEAAEPTPAPEPPKPQPRAEPTPAQPRPVAAKPSLPTFRLPDAPKPPGEGGTAFKPPSSFKPPAAPTDDKERTLPPRPFKPPPPTPAEPEASDEPEELDDVEAMEELDDVEEQPVASAPKPPPPKPAPPPLGFKPRPLAPIVPPTDKKK